MREIDKKLYSVKSNMRERDRLDGLIQRCEEQKSQLEEKRNLMFSLLEKEELDVKKLEGISLVSLIHLIKGDKEEKLDKEKKEVISAKLKYDEACRDIDNLNKEIQELKYKLNEFKNLDYEYDKLIREKEAYIKNELPNIEKKFDALMEEKIHIRNMQKEINEAIAAGETLLTSLENVRESLDSASNWGTFDMLGGGLLATMAKHDKIDTARDYIDIAQSHLRKFHRELSDVGGVINIDLEIGSFLSFADYFFDGFFVDWAVQSKIDNALDRTFETISSVTTLVSKLRKDLEDTDKKLTEVEQKRLKLIEDV